MGEEEGRKRRETGEQEARHSASGGVFTTGVVGRCLLKSLVQVGVGKKGLEGGYNGAGQGQGVPPQGECLVLPWLATACARSLYRWAGGAE